MSADAVKQELDVRGGKPSASGMFRLVACPGSWRASMICGPGESSPAAEMGTRLHADMEHGTTPADPEEAEAVAWCRETEKELAARYLGAEYGESRESRLWDASGRFSGQADVVFYSATAEAALVIDYKFGRGEVDGAERNYQLAALAVLVKDKTPTLKTIYAAILQPFASRGEPRVVKYEEASLNAARAALHGAIDAAEKPGAVRAAGYAQCKYCPALSTCPQAAAMAVCAAVDKWELLDAGQRVELYRRAKLARKLADMVDAKIKADLEAEMELPGLKLAPGRQMFTVTDAAKAFGIVSERAGLTAQEFTACCKVGMTSLDAAFHAKLKEQEPKQTVKASKEELRALLGDCAEVKWTAGSVKEAE